MASHCHLEQCLVKKLLPFFLFAFSSHAFSQMWEAIVESETNSVYSYDPVTIVREGDIVTYWELSNYGTPLKVGDLIIVSSKSKVTQDCKNNTYRIGDIIDYDGHNGQGNVVNIAMLTMTNWYSSFPGTVNEVMRTKVCKGPF